MNCPVCGAVGRPLYDDLKDRFFGSALVSALRQCTVDGHVWSHPIPAPDDLYAAYSTYYTHGIPNGRTLLGGLKATIQCASKYPVLRHVLGRTDVVRADTMWLPAGNGGRLLDVGCGNGALIGALRDHGWQAVGIDFDIAALRRNTRSARAAATAERLPFASETMEAVTANQLIEHCVNPAAFLRECHRVLRPGGVVVITTPNAKSLGQYIFDRHWRGWEPPRHLNVFTIESLSGAIRNASLQLDTIRTSGRSAWELWHASRLIRRADLAAPLSGLYKMQYRAEGVLFQLIETALVAIRRPVGEYIIAIARRLEEHDKRKHC